MKKVTKNKTNNKGFTLVELIIVIAIIAMLIAMIAPNLTSFLDTASEATMNANAKTAYTSVNAWVTQQRVAGVALPDASTTPVLVKLNGSNLKVTFQDGSTCAAYEPIATLFNAGEFSDISALEIYATDDYKVTKVVWYEGTPCVTYPQ